MNYIFGPVPSRRLGRSLGVNVIGGEKICTLDCLYCELGKTTKKTVGRGHYAHLDELFKEFRDEYEKIKDSLDVVTITARGEPTLNIDLKNIAVEIKNIILHPLAILTNSTLITDEDVREALQEFDIIVPSLDAADTETFHKINRPCRRLHLSDIIESLVDFSHTYDGKLLIEVLLLKGINDSHPHLDKISNVVNRCKYDKVQLNTAFRPTAYSNVERLTDAELLAAAIYLQEKGVAVEPVENFTKHLNLNSEADLKGIILKLVNMRPCSELDLRQLFSSSDKLGHVIDELIKEKKIITILKDNQPYFASPLLNER